MTVIFSVIYGATVFAITTPGLVPEQVLWLGQAANIPMVVLGKMIQVIANFRQGTIHILRKHLFRGSFNNYMDKKKGIGVSSKTQGTVLPNGVKVAV